MPCRTVQVRGALRKARMLGICSKGPNVSIPNALVAHSNTQLYSDACLTREKRHAVSSPALSPMAF